MSPVFSLSSWLLPLHPSRHQLSEDRQTSSPWIPHQQIHPTMGPKCGREIPDSFKNQNLTLPQASNYLHSISLVLGIISHLEVTKVYRRVCTGDRQIPLECPRMLVSVEGPVTNPQRYLRMTAASWSPSLCLSPQSCALGPY